MSRDDAIKELRYIADEMPSMECANWIEAISMAIKALDAEHCVDKIIEEIEKAKQEVLEAKMDRPVLMAYINAINMCLCIIARNYVFVLKKEVANDQSGSDKGIY